MRDPENEAGDERPATPNNLIPLAVATVWRYRILVVLAAGVGICLGLFGALVVPNQYRSIGKLFVRPGIRETITPESAFSGTDAGMSRTSSREAILNELQVLSSPQLFDKVVDRVGIDTIMAPYDPGDGDDESVAWSVRAVHAFQRWWFRAVRPAPLPQDSEHIKRIASAVLSGTVSIYPETGANVITFLYVSHAPELAQAVVNATLAAAIDMHREVFDTMSSLRTIEEELAGAEDIARTAEQGLRSYRVEKGIYDYEVQRDALLNYLSDLDRQVDSVEVEAQRKQVELDQLLALQKTMPKELKSGGSERFVINPTYETLTAFLLELRQEELRLDNEKKDLSDGEYQRRRKALEELFEETRARLRNESVQVKVQGVPETNPYFTSIEQRIDDRDIELKGLARQKEQLEAVRKTSRDRLAEFEAVLPELRRLELDSRQKRANADRLAEGVTNMRIVQRLEQLNLSNVQVMHGGTFEPNKIGPVRGKMLFNGGFFGGGVGIAMALLLMLLDRKVRGVQDVVWQGVPADGVMVSRSKDKKGAAASDLPSAFADAGADIARFWAKLPYDRRATEGLKVAFVPSGEAAEAGRAAATLAIGLALHGGERVAYVSCVPGGGWLAERAGLKPSSGWSEVLAGESDLGAAMMPTPVAGLSYLAPGAGSDTTQHPMSGAGFTNLLDRLCADHRFVIVELDDLEDRPEGRSVLGVVDAATVVICRGRSTKSSVRDSVAALRTAATPVLGAFLHEVSPAGAAAPTDSKPAMAAATSGQCSPRGSKAT